MMKQFYTKAQAIALINTETGYGRRVIEKAFDKLEAENRIKFEEGLDARSLRISRTDIELVIRVLKGEIE